MTDWSSELVPNCLLKHKVSRENQIKSSEILTEGNFPVVDQGQSLIAGFANDESKLINNGLPYIIFGDHTRCFKFIDFPFILGADGTKVLKPDSEVFDPKFFFFALTAIDIPSRGYNRHFKFLKEETIRYPGKSDQRRIAAVLSLVQRAIEEQERLIQLTTELKKTLMHKLFTKGTRGEPQKQTEIGPIPKSWEIKKLGDMAIKISKGSSPKWQGFQYTSSGVLFIRSQNVGVGRMLWTEQAFLPKEFNLKAKRSILKSGDVLINLVGASIGRVAFGGEDIEGANCNQAVCFVRLNCIENLKHFIVYYLLTYGGQEQMRRQKKEIARANLSLLDVKGFYIPIPPKTEEINKIASTLLIQEEKIYIHEHKRKVLQELFRSLLHQLMTAQIRVNDLDLSELGIETSDSNKR